MPVGYPRLGLMGRNIISEDPKVLYRYRHLQGDHREWTKRIITDSVIYFASPLSFNDPFDCKVHYQSSLSPKLLKIRYADLLKKKLPNLNRKMRREKVAADMVSLNPIEFIAKMERSLQDAANRIGVLSLSATNRNVLLWSHYAAGHSGICLKFQVANNTMFLDFTQPVKYFQDYPEINLIKNSPEEQVQAFLLTKAIDWKYEEEWRIIDVRKGPGYKKFPYEMLSEVIFGARMDLRDKREIVEWVKDRKTPIQLSQASLSNKSFSLVIEPYEP